MHSQRQQFISASFDGSQSVKYVTVSSEPAPIDVPTEELVPLHDDEIEQCHGQNVGPHDNVEVEAVPEPNIMNISMGDVVVDGVSDLFHDKSCDCFTCNTKVNADNVPIPSLVGVTLYNANHKEYAQRWQRTFRYVRENQTSPCHELLGLQLEVTPTGEMVVNNLDNCNHNWPWIASPVDIGDCLVSINHKSVPRCSSNKVLKRLCKALLKTESTTTMVFSKPGGSPGISATTIEKPNPRSNLGVRIAGSAHQTHSKPYLHFSQIRCNSMLVPSCLTQTGDDIVAVNGYNITDLLHNDDGKSLVQSALQQIVQVPRYLPIVTSRSNTRGVPLRVD